MANPVSVVIKALQRTTQIRWGGEKFDHLQGEYNAYVIEVLPPDGLTDEITDTVVNNRDDLGALLGKDNVYLRIRDRTELNDLFERQEVSTNRVEYSMPWLFILDKHPAQVTTDDKFLIVKLGGLESSKDVTDVLRTIGEYIHDDEFMRKITWEQRRKKLKEALPEVAGLAISVAGLA